jgi:DNA-binding NtrC family response regulator
VDLQALDRSLVEKALRQAKGNKSRAARLLGLTRAQLYSRLEKYGLAQDSSQQEEKTPDEKVSPPIRFRPSAR